MNEPKFPAGADISDFLPAGANLVSTLVTFVVLLIVFDLILVRWWKLGRAAWKRTEYISLAFAAVGLFGAVSQVRTSIATSYVSIFYARSQVSLNTLRGLVTVLTSKPGQICRQFVRSKDSPPADEFERTQKEYDEACAWIKDVAGRIPIQVPAIGTVEAIKLTNRPNTTSFTLKSILDDFDSQVDIYNKDVASLNYIRRQTEPGQIVDLLTILGPLLLIIALALGITKVTGELKIES
jgi:hypothetical protein